MPRDDEGFGITSDLDEGALIEARFAGSVALAFGSGRLERLTVFG
jgi:hypothetical protein